MFRGSGVNGFFQDKGSIVITQNIKLIIYLNGGGTIQVEVAKFDHLSKIKLYPNLRARIKLMLFY